MDDDFVGPPECGYVTWSDGRKQRDSAMSDGRTLAADDGDCAVEASARDNSCLEIVALVSVRSGGQRPDSDHDQA